MSVWSGLQLREVALAELLHFVGYLEKKGGKRKLPRGWELNAFFCLFPLEKMGAAAFWHSGDASTLQLRGKGGRLTAGQQRGHQETLNLWLRLPEPMSKLLRDRPSMDG